MIDEADKAPTYVTAILKSLVEDGQMVLGDGRRIVADATSEPDENIIVIHKVGYFCICFHVAIKKKTDPLILYFEELPHDCSGQSTR